MVMIALVESQRHRQHMSVGSGAKGPLGPYYVPGTIGTQLEFSCMVSGWNIQCFVNGQQLSRKSNINIELRKNTYLHKLPSPRAMHICFRQCLRWILPRKADASYQPNHQAG